MSDYLSDVQKYDKDANDDIVNKIVKHLGIALRNRDSSLVSCSDEKELERVREKWMKKKLGLSDDGLSDSIIAKVCDMMKDAKSNKSRVTFYYLCAKEADKLGDL